MYTNMASFMLVLFAYTNTIVYCRQTRMQLLINGPDFLFADGQGYICYLLFIAHCYRIKTFRLPS